MSRKDERKSGKNMRPVTIDILSAIYQSTLQVGCGYTSEADEINSQGKMTQKIISKHGIANVLVGLFYALLSLSESEIIGEMNNRTGRVFVKVGEDSYTLRPFMRGLDKYMYARWSDEMDALKMRVVNRMAHAGADVNWGISFLNFPYDPDRIHGMDMAVAEIVEPEQEGVSIDLSDMPETEEKSGT